METPASSPLTCEVQAAGDTATVTCQGKILMDNAADLKQTLKPMIGQYRRIVLNLSGVDFLDSAGLGMLVSLKSAAAATDQCNLELTNLSPRVKELLETTKLSKLFNF